jgi:asparagine synthase (glutamine-hydrolysing)
MCGIAGTFNCPQFSERDVEAMVATIRYRGVDEAGVERVGPSLLGHARLAVVDPENGHQPMSNADGTVWVIFNGEIYNFIELREELKAKGYQFKSRCDTEVLVHLWREEGEAMLDRLIGMFAFFVWDTRTNRGMLARDRQGIKPCYYMEIGEGIAFASEIKALFALPGVEPRIDDVGLNLTHVFNYCPPPRTCYEGVKHLEAGTYMLFEGTQRRTIRRYWSWPLAEPKKESTPEELAALLDDAIRLQMRFDVKGCMFLSGGVDSSVVAAHLRRQWNQPVLTAFALDCTVPGFGEYEFARRAAAATGAQLIPIRYDESIVTDGIGRMLFHADQPHGDFSFLLIRKLCEAAHEAGNIVVFTGDGPDEVMAGFTHNEAFLADQARTNFPLAQYFQRINYMPDAVRARVLQPEFAAKASPIDTFENMCEPWRTLEPIEQIAAYETGYLMPGNNLIKTDRMGAGLSIEARAPFLDHRLSELFARMPVAQRFRDGAGKYCLKSYGRRFFDEDLMFRKKSMPTLPIGEWIKGSLADWARATLRELDPSRYRVDEALRVFEEHVAGQANHTRELRTLLTTSVWMQQLKNMNKGVRQ